MNKKILGVFVNLLTVAMLAIPVMAAPAEKIPITIILTSTAAPPAEKSWVTNGGISHNQGMVRNFTIVINIPEEDNLEGEYYSNRITQFNSKTSQLIVIGDDTITLTGGTFEGRWKGHVQDFSMPPPTGNTVMHCVLHGTGDFVGQTLKFSYVGPIPVAGKIVEGTLIRPKS